MKIDKDVPIPSNGDTYSKYPFPRMEVGDSFQLEDRIEQCRSAAFKWGKNNNAKFSVKKIGENLYRCWRVE